MSARDCLSDLMSESYLPIDNDSVRKVIEDASEPAVLTTCSSGTDGPIITEMVFKPVTVGTVTGTLEEMMKASRQIVSACQVALDQTKDCSSEECQKLQQEWSKQTDPDVQLQMQLDDLRYMAIGKRSEFEEALAKEEEKVKVYDEAIKWLDERVSLLSSSIRSRLSERLIRLTQ